MHDLSILVDRNVSLSGLQWWNEFVCDGELLKS